MCAHDLCFQQKYEKYVFSSKNYHFTAFKNLCIMHGHVCVMKHLRTEETSDLNLTNSKTRSSGVSSLIVVIIL